MLSVQVLVALGFLTTEAFQGELTDSSVVTELSQLYEATSSDVHIDQTGPTLWLCQHITFEGKFIFIILVLYHFIIFFQRFLGKHRWLHRST